MTKDEMKAKYEGLIDDVQNLPDDKYDATAKATMVTALQDKLKAELRAIDAQRDRAYDKLFIGHFAKGCPKCGYKYEPTREQIDQYVAMREVSNMRAKVR